MSRTSVDMREERNQLNTQAREILDRAKAEGREMTNEEGESFDKYMDEFDKRLPAIERQERSEKAEVELLSSPGRRSLPIGHDPHDDRVAPFDLKKERAAFRSWVKSGDIPPDLIPSQRRPETRDTVIAVDAKGGYLITPVQITDDIVAIINNLVFVRALCQAAGSVTTVTDAKKLGIRKKTANMSDADWTTEVAAVTEDTSLTWDRRDLEPYLCSKLSKISVRTLTLSADAEGEVIKELGYLFGVTEEKAFLTGNGTGKPLGIFAANANGISTARDVPAASATVIAGDDLINVKYSLKAAYMTDPSTAWVVSREFVKRVRKLKVATTTGGNDLEYIWQPGLTEGAPDRILDIPFYMSEYAPGVFTAGLYVAVLGCFRFYRIAQLVDMAIQRVNELYAGTHEVGFIGRRWVDGAPVLEEAFARLRML